MSDGWERLDSPRLLMDKVPSVRVYRKAVADGYLQVITSREQYEESQSHLLHVSVAHWFAPGKPGRYPTWDEQVEACRRFAPGKRMASYIVPQEEHINLHPTAFHWWEAP